MKTKHVDGADKGKVMLYTLSTCGWCKKTKALLKELNVSYDYADVDLLSTKERESALDEVKRWNPASSFPSIVIDGKRCIVGFNEAKIRETFGE